MAYVKRQPTVIQVPGNGQPIQVPISDDSIISISNIGSVALTLSTDESFNNAWPIAIGEVQPEPGIDNLWIMNTSGTDTEVLVLTYDARFPGLVAPPSGISSGGYASLTGPGTTDPTGALSQAGDLSVDGEFISSNILDNGTTVLILGNSEPEALIVQGADIQINATEQVAISAGSSLDCSINMLGEGANRIHVLSTELSFYNQLPVPQASAPSTLADVISILTNLGLCAS